MKNFVLVYDPHADEDPVVYPFEDDENAAFAKLTTETIDHLGQPGIEVVLFRAESLEALQRLNSRYFHPEVSRRLREQPELLRQGTERITRLLGEMVPGIGR